MTIQEKFKAVAACDQSCDGKFFYAVKTTGIFCRPSCKSKTPEFRNILFFDTARDAEQGGFRPCKRCRPDLFSYEPEKELALCVKEAIDRYFSDADLLRSARAAILADLTAQNRAFEGEYRMTPSAYQKSLRLRRAKELLMGGEEICEAAFGAGFGSLSAFYKQFKKETGLSPAAYRRCERVRAL